MSSYGLRIWCFILMTHLLHVFIEICNDFRASLRQRICGFYEMVRFPGVIGALDGTHVQANAFHQCSSTYTMQSWQLQELYIHIYIYIISRTHNLIFPDRMWQQAGNNQQKRENTHDSYIYQASIVSDMMEVAPGNTCTWLLGDSGYACG